MVLSYLSHSPDHWLRKVKNRRWVNYLKTYIGDKGTEIYSTFTFNTTVGENPAENDTLEGVYGKYGAYVAPNKNEIAQH